MEVKTFAWNENRNNRCNHPLLPQGIRGLIIGKSGCDKTTLLINLLLRPGWLDYNNINIVLFRGHRLLNTWVSLSLVEKNCRLI